MHLQHGRLLPHRFRRAIAAALMVSTALLMAFAVTTKLVHRVHIFPCLHFADDVKIKLPAYSYIACGLVDGWKRCEVGFTAGEPFASWGEEPYTEVVPIGAGDDNGMSEYDRDVSFSGWDKFGVSYVEMTLNSGKTVYLSAKFPLFATFDTTVFLAALFFFRCTFDPRLEHKPRRAFEVITIKGRARTPH